MAKLVFGMNQSLDGYVNHLAFAPREQPPAAHFAVSVGPVDRMVATPPDSPGQCDPGLSDDRPRDPRFCYCP